MVFAVGLVKRCVACFNGHLARAIEGIPGIDAQVDENLVNLTRVHFDRPCMGARLPRQLDILANETLDDFQHVLHPRIDIEHFGRHGLLAGKGQQLSCHFGRSFGSLFDFA